MLTLPTPQQKKPPSEFTLSPDAVDTILFTALLISVEEHCADSGRGWTEERLAKVVRELHDAGLITSAVNSFNRKRGFIFQPTTTGSEVEFAIDDLLVEKGILSDDDWIVPEGYRSPAVHISIGKAFRLTATLAD